jgi:type II secretory pathway component PulF
MDQELKEKIDKIYISVEKTRKYFQWTLIITIVIVVLPLILMLFAIPSFISTYSGMMNSLSF